MISPQSRTIPVLHTVSVDNTTHFIQYFGYFLSFTNASTLLPSSGELCSFTHHSQPWHQGLASGEHLAQHRWSGRISYLGNIDVTKWHCVTNQFVWQSKITALLWSQWSFPQLGEWFPSLTFFLREAGYEGLPKVGFHHPSITVLLAHIKCYSPRNSPCICECIARALLQRLWLALPKFNFGDHIYVQSTATMYTWVHTTLLACIWCFLIDQRMCV